MAEKRVFKATKKLSGGPKEFRKWKEYDEGDVVIGTYTGIHTDQYDKECMIMKVEDAIWKDKKAAKNVIGKNLVLNAAGQLNKAMESMEEGTLIQVVYNGTSTIEKGKYAGKEAHVLDIDEVKEDTGEEEDEEETDDDEDYEDL